ncbi:MAG: MarR family winged helix-turn-helix transcriptional regulator [Spirochaetia bacterium]
MGETSNGFEDFFRVQNELHEIFTRAFEGTLGQESITVPQAFTLKALKEQGETCRMSDLAAMRFHTPAAMTGIVDRLIDLKLVQRHSDAKDRRVILIELTSHGRATLARVEKKAQNMMERFFDSVPEDDRAATMRMLLRFEKFLKEEINAQKKN